LGCSAFSKKPKTQENRQIFDLGALFFFGGCLVEKDVEKAGRDRKK